MPIVLGAELTVAELEELEARELRRCACHEASHREIIELLGGAAHASVWRNPSGNPDERAWRGSCRISIQPGTWKMMEIAIAVLGRDTPPENWETLFGVAGFVGTCLLEGDHEIDILNGLLNDSDMGEISASDREFMGDDVSFEDIGTVISLLTARWAEVVLEAEGLMSCARAGCP